ncbi:MAG TPA: ABC transporter permease [Candidatus Limnocylindria bacterium]|nr:ABC transporter permease [Candidatus Limnocylindria bacterium]
MTLPGFILRNALRNRRRLVLTLLSVAVSLFLLTLLQVILRGLADPGASDDATVRLVVRHKVSLANMLFAKYKTRIEQLPGVEAVTKLIWFGGIYRDEKNFFPQFACDAASLFKVMPEAAIDPTHVEKFVRQRNSCVVGRKSMERFGWSLGQKITLQGAMWPCDPELEIVGTFSGGVDDSSLFFHHEYFDELLGDQGITGLFWVRAKNPAAASALVGTIDSEFENSDAETITDTEHSFQLGFVSLLGNLKTLIGSVSAVTVFSLVLVTAGTLSMSIRERAREISILKTLGFTSQQLFSLLLAESFGQAMAGGIMGCGVAWLALRSLALYRFSRGLFVHFEATPEILARTLVAAAVLGIVACLWPAYSNTRRSVVEGLRVSDS